MEEICIFHADGYIHSVSLEDVIKMAQSYFEDYDDDEVEDFITNDLEGTGIDFLITRCSFTSIPFERTNEKHGLIIEDDFMGNEGCYFVR